MAVLDKDSRKYDARTIMLLRSGPVLILRHHRVINDSILHLKELNYDVHEIDSREQNNAADMFNAVLFKCRENHHHYPNIKSIQFWDLFTEVKITEQGGLILVLWHFDEFMKQDESYYQDLLRILVGYHYRWLLFGLQFRILIQSDNPNLKLEDIWSVSARSVSFGHGGEAEETQKAAPKSPPPQSRLSPERLEYRRQNRKKTLRTMIGGLEDQLANLDNLTSISRRDIQRSIESLTRSLTEYDELEEQ